MTVKRNAILSAGAVALATAVGVGGVNLAHRDASAQMPQDAAEAGPSGTPDTFSPGYASDAGNAATSDYSENSGMLNGNTVDELGQQISQDTCSPRTVTVLHSTEWISLPQGSFGQDFSSTVCSRESKNGCVAHTTFHFHCDGESWSRTGRVRY